MATLKPVGSMIATPVLKPLSALSKPFMDHAYDSSNNKFNRFENLRQSFANPDKSTVATAKSDLQKGIKNVYNKLGKYDLGSLAKMFKK